MIYSDMADAAGNLLKRYLQREAAAPSPGCAVGVACLGAAASLATSSTCSAEQLDRCTASRTPRRRWQLGRPAALLLPATQASPAA